MQIIKLMLEFMTCNMHYILENYVLIVLMFINRNDRSVRVKNFRILFHMLWIKVSNVIFAPFTIYDTIYNLQYNL